MKVAGAREHTFLACVSLVYELQHGDGIRSDPHKSLAHHRRSESGVVMLRWLRTS
jgi:hypothetical protein